MRWGFLNTGFRDGNGNMKFDEELALRLRNAIGPCTLRVYGWQPYTISIGFNQCMEDFDLHKIHEYGIDIVRRPTGGRAILHAHELTYSIAMYIESRSPREIYRYISEGLLHSLKLLGIDAQLSTNEINFQQHYQNPSSIPCFSHSTKYEIQFNECKLIGSAQRRYANVVLQHGSILLGPQHRQIVEFLAPHVQDSKKILEDYLAAHTIDIETILGRSVSFDETAECIKKGFESAWNMTFENDVTLTTEAMYLEAYEK
ncbi:MAG: lipoate--protein ligase family protein [Ignavibacteriae bacterium]|nr:lipoate--protein ligase family protein [Ignavibacteriota bacterium]